MASLLNTMQKWPLVMLLDHGWYMGVREACSPLRCRAARAGRADWVRTGRQVLAGTGAPAADATFPDSAPRRLPSSPFDTASHSRANVSSGPFPLFSQVDVGNEKCVAMKTPGWAGWKLTLGKLDSSNPSDGTDGDVGVRWQCGPANAGPTTPRYLPFNCGIDPLEARDLNLEVGAPWCACVRVCACKGCGACM